MAANLAAEQRTAVWLGLLTVLDDLEGGVALDLHREISAVNTAILTSTHLLSVHLCMPLLQLARRHVLACWQTA